MPLNYYQILGNGKQRAMDAADIILEDMRIQQGLKVRLIN